MEATPRWARREDGWWAGVGAILALAAGLITAFTVRRSTLVDTGGHVDIARVRFEAIAASALCAGVLLARRRWPRLPTVVVVLVASQKFIWVTVEP